MQIERRTEPTKCLIIAAGKGSRLSEKGYTKPLVPLLGLSLIERVRDGEVILAVDYNTNGNHLVDMGDVTKVLPYPSLSTKQYLFYFLVCSLPVIPSPS
jgi:hypothetical protein